MKKAYLQKTIVVFWVFLLSMFLFGAVAFGIETSGTCGDNVTWSFDEATRTLTISGNGYISDASWSELKDFIKVVVIEDGVTGICSWAFEKYDALVRVKIPGSVSVIGRYAFYDCSNLADVRMKEGVTEIGYGAFWGCRNLPSIEIPNSVESIEEYAFSRCGLTDINIPDGVFSVGDNAFLYCSNLSSVNISDSVTSIGANAFYKCENLTQVKLSSNMTVIEDSLFESCNNLTDIVLPEGITAICTSAFQNCEMLETITIPRTVEQIGRNAFWNCFDLDLVYYDGTRAEWNNILIADGNDALQGAARKYSDSTDCVVIFHKNNEEPVSYESVNPGEAVEEPYAPIRADHVFRGWYTDKELTTKYDFSTPVTTDMRLYAKWVKSSNTSQCGDDVWWRLRGSQLTIGGSGDMWDYNNVAPAPWNKYCSSIESVVIEEGVTSVGSCAFAGCENLTDVSIPEGVTTIGDSAFSGCSGLTAINLPEGITTIGSWAFAYCSGLTQFAFPEGVTRIDLTALNYCSNLKEVKIPASAINCSTYRSFDPQERGCYYNFTGCSSLERFIVAPGNPKFSAQNGVLFFEEESGDLLVSCPAKKKLVEISCSVKDIFLSAFTNCTALEMVYYEGTEDQWRAMNIDEGNEPLFNAKIIYNSHMPEASISGVVTSWNNKDDVMIRLYDSAITDAAIKADTSGMQAAYSAVKGGVTAGEDGKHFRQTFTFEGVTSGSYKLLITKPGKYIPQIIGVTVEEGSVDLSEIMLCLYGDVNDDGRINSKDVTQLSRYTAGNLSRADKLDVIGDVNLDSRVNSKDVTQLSKYTAGNRSSLDGIQ